MKLNVDKISHISHLLIDGVIKNGLAETDDSVRLLKTTKDVITKYCKTEDLVGELVRKKLQSYSKRLIEGSREWDLLYRKHFDEEIKKRW